MPLFFVDENPRRCAEAHPTSQLKGALQILCQSLVNAEARYNPRLSAPLKPNDNYPAVTDWAGDSRSNWRHMVDLGFALRFEMFARDIVVPETFSQVLARARSGMPINVPERGLQHFPRNMNPEYFDYASKPVQLHRLWLADFGQWDAEDWGRRQAPDWIAEALKTLISGRQQKLQ